MGKLRHRLRRASTILVLVVTLGACGTSPGDTDPGASQQPAIRLGWKQVKPVSMGLPTGSPLQSSALRPERRPSGLVLVNFWASYCHACQSELPMLQRLASEGNVAVVGITRDQFPRFANKELRQAGVTYTNWIDRDGSYSERFAHLIPINVLPTSALMQDGKVVAVYIGPFTSRHDLMSGLRQDSSPSRSPDPG